MSGAAWLLALATLSVDYGWRLDSDGQLEYIIQIPPSQLETLRSSRDGISSSIPPEVVRHVKRFRIVVGAEALPKDPLPAWSSEGQTLGGATPINVGASRVNPAGGDFGATTTGDLSSGYDAPGLESVVTPIGDSPGPRTVLPGPADELPGDPNDAVDEFLPIPPLPRARTGGWESESLAATLPGAVIRRDQTGDEWRPNVSAPDVRDAWGTKSSEDRSLPSRNASYTDAGPASISRTLPRRDLGASLSTDAYATLPKAPPYPALAFTVCALCLSIGGNVYLGWIAWGYYLKYRESFESWRSGRSSQE